MLNFNDMFMVDNTHSGNVFTVVVIMIIIVFFILITWSHPEVRDVGFFIGLVVIMITTAVILPISDSRDVYVAIDNPPFEISSFRNSEGASVKKINNKCYFSGVVLLRNYQSTKELEDRIESSYKLYLDEMNADKNKKKYEETIQKLEEKGEKINGD